MPIDTDILSFGEYNANCSDENTKVTQLVPLILNTGLTSSDTNKIVVRKSSIWTVSGLEAYNGHIQDFGSISNNVALVMNNTTSRIAMKALITGNTFITDFTDILTGFVYVLFLKQDSAGGKTVRFPYGASVLKSVGFGADQITAVFIVKMATGKLFIKCEAFENTMDLGAVIKEFEDPSITYPSGETVTASFTWSKAPAVSYGGVLTGLYSDWEIADDSLYSNLLFSSYGNSTDITSIQVILTQSGSVYMRTRYGGNIAGTPVVSSWDEAICEITSGEVIIGDQYWDQVVFCLNANTYNIENTPKKIDSKGYFTITNSGKVRPVNVSGKLAFRFDSVHDLISFNDSMVFRPTTLDFTFELFFSVDNPTNGTTQFIFIKSVSTGYTPIVISIGSDGKLGAGFYSSSLSDFILYSLSPLSANKIYHVAVVRSGSSFKLFLDGVLQQETTQSVTLYSNNAHPICFGTTTDYLYRFTGHIYSVRMTNSIPRYSSDFSIDLDKPYFETGNLWWTPEPKYVSNEKFSDYSNWDKVECLINGYGIANSTSIIDETGKAITIGGNTKIDVTSNLSSMIFDGNGDYMYVGNRGDFNFLHNGTCNWTVDFWFNPSAVSDDGIFDTCEGSSSNYGTTLYFQAGTGKLTLIIMRGTGSVSSGYMNGVFNYVFSTGTLYHVAITLDWSLSTDNAKLYVNGTLQSTITKQAYDPSPYISRAALMVGGFGTSYPTYMFNGKIYSFRISSYLRYTSNFTVDNTRPYFIPKPKIENWAETSLVINSYNLPVNSTDIRDAKGNAISVYGDTKIGVDSNGLQYINFTNSTLDCFQFQSSCAVLGSSDFTIQYFLYKTANNANFSRLYGVDDSTHNDVSLGIDGSGNINIYLSSTGSSWNLLSYTTGPSILNNVLYHLALVRSGGNLDIYLNGVKTSVSTGLSTTSLSANGAVRNVGGQPSGTNRSFIGRIYGFSLVKKALYTSNFNVDLTNPYFPAIDSISDLWIDANDFSKITIDTNVSKIVDKSGNMREAIQATSSSQPAVVQNAQNGLIGLNFDGTDDYLNLGKISNSKPGNWHIFAVCRFDITSGSRTLMASCPNNGDAAGTSICLALFSGYPNKLFYQFGNGSVSSYGYTNNDCPSGQIFLYEQKYISGENFTRIYVDSVEQAITKDSSAASACSGTMYDLCIGRLGEYAGNYLDGLFLQTLYSSKLLANFMVNKIEGYIAHKWGLTANLPANHQYKTNYPSKGDFRTDDYWYATVLCINGTDIIRPTEIVDSSNNNKITVYGDTKALIDANNLPYINFDGTGDYITVKDSVYLRPTTENYTVECFFSVSVINAVANFLVIKATSTGHNPFTLIINGSGYLVGQFSSNTPTQYTITGTTVIQAGILYHAAIVKNGNVFNLFLNGVIEGTSTQSITLFSSTSDPVCVGAASNGLYPLNGKIYSIRVTKGVARYTSNFSVDLSKPYFPKLQNKQNIIPILKPDAWFDADDSSTITVEGTGRISQWADKSGNNYHATMGTDVWRPVLSEGVIGGKDALYFDGYTRFLQLGTVLGKPANFTVFVVGVFHSQSSKTNMCGSGDGSGQSKSYWGDIGIGRTANDGKVEYSFGDGLNYASGRTTNAVIVTNEWFYGGWVYSGGNKPIWYQRGVEKPVTYEAGSATTISGTAYNFSLGRTGEYNGQYLNGKIAEVLIFRRGLSYNEILLVSEYLENKWFK